MEQFLKVLTDVNSTVNGVVWGPIGLILLIGTGLVLSFGTKFFQISHLRHWWKYTIGSVFKKGTESTRKTDAKSISPFQALCTALAATVGTGNIAGVATAIVVGGPGAVFWMWVAAFFGMMAKFGEITLGLYYRRRNQNGEWSGGAMYTLQDGVGGKRGLKTVGKVLAILFALFTVLASFGIGNLSQINSITQNLRSAFFSGVTLTVGETDLLPLVLGVLLTAVLGAVVLGGLKRIASVAERVVPLMAILYILGSLLLIGLHYDRILPAFGAIFQNAFNGQAALGGTLGVVIVQGCKRGVFSNEAGLGSSAMVHASADTTEPVRQGLWGIFEVFFDTIVICTLTALTVVCSGVADSGVITENNASTAVSEAFLGSFGVVGQGFVAIALTLFAFTTVLGWSQYGAKAVEYLFGVKGAKIYRMIFVLTAVLGAVMTSSLAWEISDTFNGLMMLPNLVSLLLLSPLLVKLTKNYVARHIKGKDEKPMLSYRDTEE